MKKIYKVLYFLLLLTVIILLTSLGVSAQSPVRYDVSGEGVVSGYYPIDRDRGFITGIAPGTPAQKLLDVCIPADGAASTQSLATGTTITFPSQTDAEGLTLTAIVTGDLNGDAHVTITDMLMVKSAILGAQLTESAATAADLNYDGQVSITDFLKVKSCLLGLETVQAAPASQTRSLMLMTPGSCQAWGVQGVAYLSDDEAVVAVGADGTVTAGAGQGTTFIYALDAEGAVLARQLVTVLEEPLTVSFINSSYLLIKEQTLAAAYQCNHPVMPVIDWQTSDPTVVEVSNGILTAKGSGTATVTATVQGGGTAELAVKVTEAVSDWVDMGQHRYYFDENGDMYHGWLKLGGDTYYLKENGVMAIGQVTIDGVNRFFTSTGKHVLMPNPWNPIPEDYTFELVEVGSVKVNSECADALQRMVAAGKKAGYNCNVTNVYRSLATQQFLWDRRVKAYMDQGYSRSAAEKLTGQSVAIPGHSEHQMGLSADISKGNEPVLKWLREHCWEYGFILRYPQNKMDITGITYEPWHFRYVGVELAAELKELGLCMEEYMEMLTRQELSKENAGS